MKYLIFVLFITWAKAQLYEADQWNPRIGLHFKEIPKHFEIKSGTNNRDFHKLFDEIENLARHENISVVYKVKLEVGKPIRYHGKKIVAKRVKTKKYNIPLKKNSMKLSNFEVMLRKMAEKSGHIGNVQNFVNLSNTVFTTETDKKVIPTRQIQLKYKPIISRVKTNYTKIIKPVRKKFFTLT